VSILPYFLLYIPDFAVIDDVVIASEEAVVVAVINRKNTQINDDNGANSLHFTIGL